MSKHVEDGQHGRWKVEYGFVPAMMSRCTRAGRCCRPSRFAVGRVLVEDVAKWAGRWPTTAVTARREEPRRRFVYPRNYNVDKPVEIVDSEPWLAHWGDAGFPLTEPAGRRWSVEVCRCGCRRFCAAGSSGVVVCGAGGLLGVRGVGDHGGLRSAGPCGPEPYPGPLAGRCKWPGPSPGLPSRLVRWCVLDPRTTPGKPRRRIERGRGNGPALRAPHP